MLKQVYNKAALAQLQEMGVNLWVPRIQVTESISIEEEKCIPRVVCVQNDKVNNVIFLLDASINDKNLQMMFDRLLNAFKFKVYKTHDNYKVSDLHLLTASCIISFAELEIPGEIKKLPSLRKMANQLQYKKETWNVLKELFI